MGVQSRNGHQDERGSCGSDSDLVVTDMEKMVRKMSDGESKDSESEREAEEERGKNGSTATGVVFMVLGEEAAAPKRGERKSGRPER